MEIEREKKGKGMILLTIQLRNKDWISLEGAIEVLKKDFPGIEQVHTIIPNHEYGQIDLLLLQDHGFELSDTQKSWLHNSIFAASSIDHFRIKHITNFSTTDWNTKYPDIPPPQLKDLGMGSVVILRINGSTLRWYFEKKEDALLFIHAYSASTYLDVTYEGSNRC